MAQKKTINLAIPEPLLSEFNEVCQYYGHAKQKGLVLSAAMLMFLEADPEDQGKALERILIADVRSGVESMVDRAKQEQARRIASREQHADSSASASDDGKPQSHNNDPDEAPAPPLPRAAKKAQHARKPLTDLPEPPSPERSDPD